MVEEYLRYPEVWKRRVGYGPRWMAETVFSVFKLLFGEQVRARSLPNMIRELFSKHPCTISSRNAHPHIVLTNIYSISAVIVKNKLFYAFYLI